MPLLAGSLEGKVCPFVFMFDASLDGYGVMRGSFEPEEIRPCLEHHERWRFKLAAENGKRVQARAAALLTLDYMEDVSTVR